MAQISILARIIRLLARSDGGAGLLPQLHEHLLETCGGVASLVVHEDDRPGTLRASSGCGHRPPAARALVPAPARNARPSSARVASGTSCRSSSAADPASASCWRARGARGGPARRRRRVVRRRARRIARASAAGRHSRGDACSRWPTRSCSRSIARAACVGRRPAARSRPRGARLPRPRRPERAVEPCARRACAAPAPASSPRAAQRVAARSATPGSSCWRPSSEGGHGPQSDAGGGRRLRFRAAAAALHALGPELVAAAGMAGGESARTCWCR